MAIKDLNESPRPRVLVMLPDETRDAAVSALDGLAGTVQVVESLKEIHPDEWDAIVTSDTLGYKYWPPGRTLQLRRAVPAHFYAIVLQEHGEDFRDIIVNADGTLTLQINAGHAMGKMAVAAEGMPDDLNDLVREQLVPLVAGREMQFGVKVTDSTGQVPNSYDGFQPLLVGPDALVYAARYSRAPDSPVWLLPGDLPNLEPWFRYIFTDWHRLNPDTYPGAPGWYDADEWMTPVEQDKAAALAEEGTAFEAVKRAHEERMSGLQGELVAARAESAAKERQLIAGQSFELQAQVLDALRELGFDVEDMDQFWDPKEPREDYRIRDKVEPGWMVIGDATGTTKGVKGTKLMTVERYVTKYVKDNPSDPIPNFWLIANHFIDRDPDARPKDMIRKDDLKVVEDAGNLVLDTVALFRLVMAARRSPELADPIRAVLRAATGQFTAQNASDWIAANTP